MSACDTMFFIRRFVFPSIFRFINSSPRFFFVRKTLTYAAHTFLSTPSHEVIQKIQITVWSSAIAVAKYCVCARSLAHINAYTKVRRTSGWTTCTHLYRMCCSEISINGHEILKQQHRMKYEKKMGNYYINERMSNRFCTFNASRNSRVAEWYKYSDVTAMLMYSTIPYIFTIQHMSYHSCTLYSNT